MEAPWPGKGYDPGYDNFSPLGLLYFDVGYIPAYSKKLISLEIYDVYTLEQDFPITFYNCLKSLQCLQ